MEGFDRFVAERGQDLKRIARATRREHQYEDVVNEAWVMALTISAKYDVTPDFRDARFQDLLIRHLYQELVRYTELNVRHAVRLDHSTRSDAEEGSAHPLMNELSGDDGKDPLSYLLAIEDTAHQRHEEDDLHSLAGAWLKLIRRCGNRMGSVADYLLISISYAYRCCAKAQWLAIHQGAIALKIPRQKSELRPWRRYRMARTPRQLEFDFEERLELHDA